MSKVREGFLAGAAQVDITPPLGTVINGDFVAHIATQIDDPLFAKALVLKSGNVQLVFVVVDICVMGKEFIDEVKSLIEQGLRIKYHQIMISSTHTHAAGSVEEVHLAGADRAYRLKLPRLIFQAVKKAKARLQPAQVAFGGIDAPEHVFCRRYFMREGYEALNPVTGGLDQIKTNPFGAEKKIIEPVAAPDPELGFMAVKSREGQWISLLANYSLHYVGDWDNGTISADYFGFFSRAIGEKLQAGKEFVGIMSNGTSGDINNWDFPGQSGQSQRNFEKSRRIGADLAGKVTDALLDLRWETDPILRVKYGEHAAFRRMPSTEELERARGIVQEGGFERLVPDRDGWRKIYAREQVLLNEFDPVAVCPLQVFRIGEGMVGGLPGEFFAETGLALKEVMAGRRYFTIGLANGNVGYVPPQKELDRGGYETWRCRISNLEAGAEEKLRQRLLSLMEGLE